MENASKALIIAGAILLSILIIAIGMYIYNSSQNSIGGAVTQISQQEIDAFNQPWEMYEGKQTGANVKALISKLNSNATKNAEEETKLPNLYYEATENDQGKGTEVISHTKQVKGSGGNDFNTARTKISAGHVYGVTLVTHQNTGLISGVIITYDPDWNVNITEDKANAKAKKVYSDYSTNDEVTET